ncbi:DUF134 domain-containing protein [Desulfovibrio sp. TomC]|uniref:DUF134 domain-containing protein n=1 Tax=Desulfovibrio sp. TomC TaxID=1562888 RepID=UPI000574D3F3|nr:DUF134 domain-containing protein [Desulfovibrio sp. TomC]KHK03705.1 Protein of unknown function DUF134 [Desulfovibrio sp. TomC]
MPRQRRLRRVAGVPAAAYFKPQGRPLRGVEEIVLTVEGLEALRLADLEGLSTEAAAAHMAVSRHTFGRVLTEARQTVARALVGGLALRIEGGNYQLAGGGPAATANTDMRPLDDGVSPTGGAQEDQAMKGQGQCGRGSGQGQGGRQGRGQGQGQGLGQGQSGKGQGRGQCNGAGAGLGQGRGRSQNGGPVQGALRQGNQGGQGNQESIIPAGQPTATAPMALGTDSLCPACGAAAPAGEICPACGVAQV